MDTKLLTQFQIELSSRIKSELPRVGKSLLNEKIDGKKEFFITGEIAKTNLKIWIYKDSAEFTDLKKVDSRYEAADYDSLELLIDSYLQDLLEILAKGGHPLAG